MSHTGMAYRGNWFGVSIYTHELVKLNEPRPDLRIHYIYGLVDPISKLIFYVGSSTDPIKRYKTHWWDSRSKANSYIRALLSRGIIPYLWIIDKTPLCDRSTANIVEKFWQTELLKSQDIAGVSYNYDCKLDRERLKDNIDKTDGVKKWITKRKGFGNEKME